MFRTIVWATDGSESADRALPYAKELVSRAGGKLVVVHAKELLVGRAGGHPVQPDEEDVEAKIQRQVAELRAAGLDASFTLASGPQSHAAQRSTMRRRKPPRISSSWGLAATRLSPDSSSAA